MPRVATQGAEGAPVTPIAVCAEFDMRRPTGGERDAVDTMMTDEHHRRSGHEAELAKFLIASITSHQTRGLCYAAHGPEDAVIHGRVNLLAVAEDVWTSAQRQTRSPRRSWAPWFAGQVASRRITAVRKAARAQWAEQAADEARAADAALARLRLRDEGPR